LALFLILFFSQAKSEKGRTEPVNLNSAVNNLTNFSGEDVKLNIKVAIFIFTGAPVLFAQLPQQIEKETKDLLLGFSTPDTVQINFENLNSIINSEIDSENFEKDYFTSLQVYDSLKSQLSGMEIIINNVPRDSGLVIFNQWYLQFCKTFYNYFKPQFFSLKKIKILFFSTSVSCHCTLEMCKNQLIDILKFVKDSNNKYYLWTVDSYENWELQIKYDTYFSPSVIVFNSDNTVLQKIEYDENMISELNNYLATKDNYKINSKGIK
jgi:hypothetical protein